MIPYDNALDNARRLSIATLLRYAAQRRDLLTKDHTFQVTVRTEFPGVVLPRHLYARPEVVLILQHQYRNLTLEPNGFGVDLWFNGAQFRCYVPLDAISTFIDKTKGFAIYQEVRVPALPPPPPPPIDDGTVIRLDTFRKRK